jgi:hypothetical protein
MLFCRKHEAIQRYMVSRLVLEQLPATMFGLHGKDELSSKEHLNEESPCYRRAS